MAALDSTWNDTLHSFLRYVNDNPKDFIVTVVLCLTPLMLISGFLSLKLARMIAEKEKEEKKKARRDAKIAKAKKAVKAD